MRKGGDNNTSGNNKSYVTQPLAHLDIVFILTLRPTVFFSLQYSRCVMSLAAVATVLLATMLLYNLLVPRVRPSHPAPASRPLPITESCSDPCQWVDSSISQPVLFTGLTTAVLQWYLRSFLTSLENVPIFSINKEASFLLLKSLNMKENQSSFTCCTS